MPGSLLSDERTLKVGNRIIGFLGPRSASYTFAWLASHRDRLRAFVIGGKRLSITISWDSKGASNVNQTERDVAAIAQLVYGDGGRDG